jgi:hypothetical protein
MSAALAAVIWRKTVSPKYPCPCLRAGWFLLAATLFLAPLHAFAAASITISPSSVNLNPNGTQQFTATVTGASDTSVTWTIQEGPSGGTVTGSGLYSAPVAVGVYHVVATSHADPSKSATANVGVPGFERTGLLYPGPCTSTLLPNGTILYTGGASGPFGPFANAEIYDPVASRSTPTGKMIGPLCSETATLLPNGKVLFAGGVTPNETAAAELYDPISGTFTATGSMSVARVNHTATLLPNGMVLIAGGTGTCGGSTCFFNSAELYDPISGTFSLATGKMVLAASTSVATVLSNGKVLIVGGFTSTTDTTGTAVAELYDPSTGLFTQTGSMIFPREIYFTATPLQNGKVLIAGGVMSTGNETAAELYDPSTGTFSLTGSLNAPRTGFTATLLSNARVLIAGGTQNPAAAPAELYDPGTGVFSLTGALQEHRVLATATLLANGTVIVAGGNNGAPLASIETYDPSSGVFSSQSTFMRVERSGQSTTKLADGRFLIIGGLDGSRTLLSSAEIYDPSTNKFTLTGSLAAAREMHTATLLGNGMVLVVGGYNDLNLLTVVPTAELYNPVTGTFGPAPNPNVARAEHTATLLQNGKVLIAGGQLAIPPIAAATSAELYDPVAGTFTLAGNMNAPRSNHTATLLNNGRVLIAEGVFDFNEISTGAKYPPYELYDPSGGTFTPLGGLINADGSLPGPFDSIVLSNGQVLVDSSTIFDPASNTITFSTPTVNNAEGGAYKFVLLPTNQVFEVGGSAPQLYDPPSNKFETLGGSEYTRVSPGAALLPNGKVLIAAGAVVKQVEFYVGPVPSPAPVVTSVSPDPVTGFTPVTITVQGANFTTGSVIMDEFQPLQTTYVSDTQLTAIFPLQSLLLAGNHPMQVVNIEDSHIATFTLSVVNPNLQASNSFLQFPNVDVGSSASLAVSFTNVGNLPLKIDSMSISGTDSADFTFNPTTCSPAQGATLAPSGVCMENIKFTPPSPGPFSATLTVNYETPNSPLIIPLTGTGVGVPVATIVPSSLTFNNQVVGTASAPQSFTITNTGTGPLVISVIELNPPTNFTMSNNCPSSLALAANCSVNVTFVPLGVGTFGSVVVVTTNDGVAHGVQLTGTAIGVPGAAIAPLSLTFGSQAVGTSSTAQQVLIASAGTGSLAIANIVLSDTADFQMTSNCSSNLAPNTNCSLGVTFAPVNVGSISATIVVTANDGGSPHTIQLSGTGTGFALAPATGSSASATVPAGQPATYQLSLTPQAFSGPVTLTCTPVTAIPNATCSITSPNPVTLSGTTATVVTVSVSTMSHSGMSLPSHTRRYFGPGAYKLPVARWVFYLLLLLALAGASRKFRRVPLALASALLVVMLIAGCAGGSGGSSGPPSGGGSTGTPPGTYQLLVTASASGVSSKTTLTLVVQ